jgi:hypothetical protein
MQYVQITKSLHDRSYLLGLKATRVRTASRSAGLATRETPTCRPLTHCSRALAERPLALPRQMIDSFRKTNPPFVMTNEESTFSTSVMLLRALWCCWCCCQKRSSLLFSHGKGYWTRTGVTAAIGTGRACATATYETCVHGSESIGLFFGLNVRFCTRFMAD